MLPPIRKALVIGTCVVVTISLAVIALDLPEWQFARSFEQIEVGASRDAVVDRLGKALTTSTDCYVAQFVQFEKPAQWTKASGVAYCAHWIGPGPVGRFYAVGFTSDNKVVGIAYGDS